MKNHVKVYIKYFGYVRDDVIICEMCPKRAVDIHHIDPRGMGGSKEKDDIENLVALSRDCHQRAETDPEFNRQVKEKHMKYLNWFRNQK